jgi:hypothetical protein
MRSSPTACGCRPRSGGRRSPAGACASIAARRSSGDIGGRWGDTHLRVHARLKQPVVEAHGKFVDVDLTRVTAISVNVPAVRSECARRRTDGRSAAPRPARKAGVASDDTPPAAAAPRLAALAALCARRRLRQPLAPPPILAPPPPAVGPSASSCPAAAARTACGPGATSGTEQSVPVHPASQTQKPRRHSPRPEQPFRQKARTGSSHVYPPPPSKQAQRGQRWLLARRATTEAVTV